MTIAITGVDGPLGRRTAELLLEQVDPSAVRLLANDPFKLKDFAKRGIDARKANFRNPTGLKQDLAGVDRLFMINIDPVENRLDLQRQAIACAKIAGVRHIVYTSVPQPSADNPCLEIDDHAGTEQAIRESRLDWTLLRVNLFSELQIPAAAEIVASGQHFNNAGDGATAYVSRGDVARAAANILVTDGHEKTVYDLSGPEAVTQHQFAAILTELTGVEIDTLELDDDALFAGLLEAGVGFELAEVLVSYGAATRGGYFGKVTTDLADLTGRKPATLRDVLAAHADELTA